MQVKSVLVVQSHRVDINLDGIDWEEMTTYVEVHATVCETRPVGDGGCRERYSGCICADRKAFPKCLYAVENA